MKETFFYWWNKPWGVVSRIGCGIAFPAMVLFRIEKAGGLISKSGIAVLCGLWFFLGLVIVTGDP